jgi:hypothetical protein
MSDRPSTTRRPRRLLTPAPSIAAVLVLLVGSVLPATPSQSPDGLRATTSATAEPAPTDEPPASVTEVPEPAPATPATPAQPGAGGTTAVRPAVLPSNPWSLPDVLLAAYRQAVAGAPPACHLPVGLLAAIGQVESGSLAGRSLDAAHRAVPPVLGPVLDGVGTAAISDTDGGRLDGNSRWDRAVGPMQFIPGTWAAFGVDGDGDGRVDPQNVYDAAASAAGYLCAGGRDLALPSDLRSAILAYNHSTAYLATVLAWQQRFDGSGVGTIQTVVGPIQTVVGTVQGVTDKNSTPTKLPAAVSAASGTVHLTPTNIATVRTADKLAFTTAPSPTATSDTGWARQPAVTIQDAAGNTVTTDTSPLTLTLTTPDGATLTCATNPTTAVAGIAQFTGCAIDKAGTYTLTATDESLTSTTSSDVTITAGAPAKLAFTTAPSPTAISDTGWASQPAVTIQDAAGNTVTTDTSPLTLTLTTPKGATLTCATNPTQAAAGIAQFTGCAIDKAGTYTLTATDESLTSTTSATITITAAAGTV